MTASDFDTGIKRLIIRFGAKNFDAEFIKLVWREVEGMSGQAFTRFVDAMIGSRSPNKPPLLSEFREARLAEEKLKFQNDVRGASVSLKRRAPEEMRKHLRLVLSRDFGGVESVSDALEVASLKRKMGQGDDGGAA